MSNPLWNLFVVANPDSDTSDFDTVTHWAADYITALETTLAKITAKELDDTLWKNYGYQPLPTGSSSTPPKDE